MPGLRSGAGTGRERSDGERDVAGPDVELGVGRAAVVRPTDGDLGRCLVERQREHAGRLQLLARRRARVGPAAGQQLLGERLEHGVLLVGIRHGRRRAEHDDRAVVDRVLEDRAGEHDAVEERHGDAGGDALADGADGAARRGAVDVEQVADACMQRRDHVRLPVALEAEMADERGVEDRVDRRCGRRRPSRARA